MNAQPGAFLDNFQRRPICAASIMGTKPHEISTGASMQCRVSGRWAPLAAGPVSADAPLEQPRLAEPDLETLWDGLITARRREASMPRQPPDFLGAVERPVPLFHTAGWLKASAALMGPLIMGLTQFQESRQAPKLTLPDRSGSVIPRCLLLQCLDASPPNA